MTMTAPTGYLPYIEHPGYCTVGEIMALYDTTAANVYRLASDWCWRRYWLDGRIRYHRDDVDHTLGKPA